ncbi:MAG: YeeE/YedE family protein [Bacteroidales bacterium]|nr:YeeE/YedE family protein [Bacteroidales bacterium]NPV36259.1 YeeE/YedE family protein [Bacteroidales bacterium]
MGPLITNGIIDPGWNNYIALLLGMAFGFVLESAGFSSSRKLAGVFYGYDFVVLKVFFTAAVVSVIGIYLMGHLGWLDISKLYIQPAYVQSTIVGGVIMGIGFLMGGFCPGTSFTGVAIGKIDAMVFSVGMFIGVLIFGELYPLFENLYNAGNLGYITITEYFGIQPGIFILGLTVVALVAFYVTAIIQQKVKKVDY